MVQIIRLMLLIDGQAGIPSGRGGSSGLEGDSGAGKEGDQAPVYGLTVSGPGLVPYVDPAFRVEAGRHPLDLVVEAPGRAPQAKTASSSGILGDVNAVGQIDLTDASLIAVYLNDPSDPSLPAGLGEPVGPSAWLSPNPFDGDVFRRRALYAVDNSPACFTRIRVRPSPPGEESEPVGVLDLEFYPHPTVRRLYAAWS